jgi:hypothetical protein
MVLMNGSKMARNSASISNYNQGGGPNKQGLISTVGRPASVYNLFMLKQAGWCCLGPNKSLKPIFVSWVGNVGQTQPKRR